MSEPFIGQIQAFGFNFAPRSWALCDGQLLQISQFSALFSLLGTTYGGDGRTTFGLPDLRGRAALHFGSGPGLTPRVIGERSGAETVALDGQTIPSHSHGVHVTSTPADSADPVGKVCAMGAGNPPTDPVEQVWGDLPGGGSLEFMDPNAMTDAGGGQAHENLQPMAVINWCIALVGTFPSRN